MTQLVKVAEFRSSTDHLFRLANVDYHACAAAREVRNWQTRAQRVLALAKDMECKRASAYDLEQYAQALDAVQGSLASSTQRIECLISRGYA